MNLIKIWWLKYKISEQDSYRHWLWRKYYYKALDRYITAKNFDAVKYMTKKELKEYEKELNTLFNLQDELKIIRSRGGKSENKNK